MTRRVMEVAEVAPLRKVKYLIPMQGCMGISLPIGTIKQGGTCFFSTVKCRKHCVAKKESVTKKHQLMTKALFDEKTPNEISEILTQEMDVSGEVILHWFASGDCLPEWEDKITDIMRKIQEEVYVQVGFTRNKSLINNVYEHDTDQIRLALTVKSKKELEESGYRLKSLPDFLSGKAQLFSGGYYYDCGVRHREQDKELKTGAGCFDCLSLCIGCFHNLSGGPRRRAIEHKQTKEARETNTGRTKRRLEV